MDFIAPRSLQIARCDGFHASYQRDPLSLMCCDSPHTNTIIIPQHPRDATYQVREMSVYLIEWRNII
jgi:hypothetical protein